MTQRTKNPAPRANADNRAPNSFTPANGSEHTHPASDLQSLRVRHLARRFRLAPGMALAVAGLFFEGGRA